MGYKFVGVLRVVKRALVDLCHMNHMSYRSIEELNKRDLLDSKLNINPEFYETCVIGKQTRVKFKTG